MLRKRRIKLSFVVIAFNADDFIYESLKSVYSFAHEIFVVEGAVKCAWHIANPDGSSTDKTNEILDNFPDLDKKLTVIRGKWKNKVEMTNAPLRKVTGHYLWRLDADEVYKEVDLYRIDGIIENRPQITHVTLQGREFFHGYDRIIVYADGSPPYCYERIWKFVPGCYFVGHRPAKLYCPTTGKYMDDGFVLTGNELAEMGIHHYHYSYVTEKQVKDKLEFMYNLFLRQFGIGMPFARVLCRIPHLGRFLFSLKSLDNMRKRRSFPDMNFNYFETVWKPWIHDRKRVEREYGVSLKARKRCITVAFEGEHPKVIQEKCEM